MPQTPSETPYSSAHMRHALQVVEAVQAALDRPSNVVTLSGRRIDDEDRAYVAMQFDEIVDLIERLPRTYRVFMGADMATRDRASLTEIAGLLAAMGARAAPSPKDAA